MAVRTVTDFCTEIRIQAGILGLDDKWTEATVTGLMNQAFRRTRAKLYAKGSDNVLKTVTAAHGGSTGATSGWPGTILDLSSVTGDAFAGVRRLMVYAEDCWQEVPRIELSGVADWDAQWPGTTVTGPPEGHVIVGQEAESAASGLTGNELQVLILPAMDTAYTFQLTYLPEWPDPSGTDQIPDDIGICDTVMWEVVRRIHIAEKNLDEAGVAAAETTNSFNDILHQHRRLNRTGGFQRRPHDAGISLAAWRRL